MNQYDRKIIATSAFLSYKGTQVPRVSNEFVQAYCNKGGIDKVMVEYEEYLTVTREDILDSQGITPKVMAPKVSPDNTITIKPLKDTYSKEEVKQLLVNCVAEIASEAGLTNTAVQMEVVNKRTERWWEDNL